MEQVHVMPENAVAFCQRLLAAHEIPQGDARIIAQCLVRADLRGVDTHGIHYLPHYLGRVRKGLVNPAPKLEARKVTPVAATLDAQNGFGFVAATHATAEAVAMAAENGIGVVSVHRSTHFGMAANYVLQAMEGGYIALVFTNASRAMPPWGGCEALLGTGPLAAGAPGGYVLDMSPTVAARGKIRRAARRGQKIPEGYALDKHGRPTTDPQAALDGGVLMPIGGAKGSGLSMLMDIFGGVISGAAYAGDVRNQFEDYDAPQNVGHFFLALKPDLFIPRETFDRRMAVLRERVHAVPPAEGFDEVLMPGEIEQRLESERRVEGIPYHAADIEKLQKEAERAGVPPLETGGGRGT